MSTAQRDPLSPQLGAFLRIGGFSPSVMDQYVPVLQTHDLERGPNPPFIPWEISAAITGVAAQWSYFSFGVGPAAAASGRAVLQELELLTLDANATGTFTWIVRGNGALSTVVPIRTTDFTLTRTGSYDPNGGSDFSTAVGSMAGSIQNTATDIFASFVQRFGPLQQNILRRRDYHVVLQQGQFMMIRPTALAAGLIVTARGKYYE